MPHEELPLGRSPELMSPVDTALLVIDVQQKLMPFVPKERRIIWNIRRLIDAAEALQLTVLASKQYPQGLGPTVPELASRLKSVATKQAFSCAGCADIMNRLEAEGRHKVLAVGIEAHVCVQQTVLDLLSSGFRVYVAVDAVGSRFDVDRETALRRMDSAGATLTTTESAMFEWCGRSDRPEFKKISALVKESPPS